jgi:hypothetical protein
VHAPHENSYYVTGDELADFLAEVILAGGNEVLWRIEAVTAPPVEAVPGESGSST